MRVSFDLRSLDTASAEHKVLIVGTMVEALARANTAFLIANPRTPPMYLSGVSYDPGVEWLDIPALLLARKGDCKSLVAWRIAEMRRQGAHPKVHAIITTIAGVDTFHVQVTSQNIIEDPSTRLGMR